ncbi:MAG: hypothetical protein ACFFCS_03230 [Candidatus Hodarchaeota archaeon]
MPKVSACMKCREYVVIRDGVYKNQKARELFKRDHSGHLFGTLDYSEVKEGFKTKTAEYESKV